MRLLLPSLLSERSKGKSYKNILKLFSDNLHKNEQIYTMNVYCVKEKRVTPNVKGSEKLVNTKNNRKLLKLKWASFGKTKTRFLPLY